MDAGRFVLKTHGGTQTELHAGIAWFANPASSLQAAAAPAAPAAPPRVAVRRTRQLQVEQALLLPSALPAALRRSRLQHVGDRPHLRLFGSVKPGAPKGTGTEQESPPDPSHLLQFQGTSLPPGKFPPTFGADKRNARSPLALCNPPLLLLESAAPFTHPTPTNQSALDSASHPPPSRVAFAPCEASSVKKFLAPSKKNTSLGEGARVK